ncbi:hypothetical protein GCM10009122_24760 [Fulvivirga kasyanovii]
MSLEKNKKYNKKGGGFVLEIVNTAPRITSAIEQWNHVYISSITGESTGYMVSGITTPYSSELFVGQLPEGKYMIAMMKGEHTIMNMVYLTFGYLPPWFLAFEVKNGEINNLGTVLYHPLKTMGSQERVNPPYVISKLKSDHAYLFCSEKFPVFFTGKAVNRINQPDSLQSANAQLKSAARPVLGAMSDKGQMFFGCNMGSLMVKDSSNMNKFHLEGSGKILSLSAFGDEIVVGGENGLFGFFNTANSSWKGINLPDRVGNVFAIEKLDNSRFLLLVHRKDTLFELWAYDYHAGKFSLLESFTKTIKSKIAGLVYPVALSHEEVVRVFIDERTWHINKTTLEVNKLTGGGEYNFIYEQPNGIITGSKHNTWRGRDPLEFSNDGGKTWVVSNEKVNVFTSIGQPIYVTSDSLFFRTRRNYKLAVNELNRDNHVSFLKSEDYGENWQPVGNLPLGCYNFIHEVSNDDKFVVGCESGDIMQSEDQGISWELLYKNNEIDLDEYPKYLQFVPMEE